MANLWYFIGGSVIGFWFTVIGFWVFVALIARQERGRSPERDAPRHMPRGWRP